VNGLSEFLIDLIFRQKSAVIPELGSFRFEVSPARMNFGENLIYPPSQQLVFSESTSDEGEVSFLDFLIKRRGLMSMKQKYVSRLTSINLKKILNQPDLPIFQAWAHCP
jgi:hypothetical protein